MSQMQCGHTQGDDTHCSGCGGTWKEIYAEAWVEYRKTWEKIGEHNTQLSSQYTAAYWAMKRVAEGMKRAAEGMMEVESALRHFQEVEAKWPERGIPI